MARDKKDILTTAEAAKLLGVSIRTAQLLIEGGTIPSWKTPGGHRRVYREDIMRLIQTDTRATAPSSATVVIIASGACLARYDALFAEVAECNVEGFEDVLAALVSVGSLKPHAIIVDGGRGSTDRIALLHSLAGNAALGSSRILAVGLGSPLPAKLLARIIQVEAPEAVIAEIRSSLSDKETQISGADLPYPIALNEGQRLVALEQSGLVDSAPEGAFDRLTWLAAQGLDSPIALLTLLTPDRQWFKSRVGLDFAETPRSWAFCNHTIMQKRVFSVEDLGTDPRFSENPAVEGKAGFRFYAGAPVLDEQGFALGSLCVIDVKPRRLDEDETQMLLALASLASDEVRLRSLDRRLRHAQRPGPREARAN